MKRTKLRDRILPKYTKGEEIFNMTSHIVGGALGIVALVLCVVFAAVHGNGYGVVSGAIYGVTMVILYTMSSIYHGLSPKRYSKRVFQVLDHCSICTLREYSTALGWTIFGVIWFVAILGIILNSIDIKKFRVFSMICYLVMGWCIVFKINLLPELLGTAGFVLLLLGGLAYTIGAILYGLGKKHKYMHSVFHLFILLGSLLQFFTILLYVM